MQTKDNAHFHIVTVKAWVKKGDKYLLARRGMSEVHMPGVWSIPGGKVDDDGETVNILQETLKREVLEEVGVEITDEIYLVWTMFWDFLWFILNPYYGWEKFAPKAVWWFGEEPWLMNKLPVKYFVQIGISIFLIVLAIYTGAKFSLLMDHFVMIMLFILFTVLTHLLVRPIFHKYYWALHQKT